MAINNPCWFFGKAVLLNVDVAYLKPIKLFLSLTTV